MKILVDTDKKIDTNLIKEGDEVWIKVKVSNCGNFGISVFLSEYADRIVAHFPKPAEPEKCQHEWQYQHSTGGSDTGGITQYVCATFKCKKCGEYENRKSEPKKPRKEIEELYPLPKYYEDFQLMRFIRENRDKINEIIRKMKGK